MLGQQLKLLIIIGLALLIQACGPSNRKAPQFIPGQIVDRGDGGELSLDRRLTRTWKDYDGDKISDRMDSDIDDDGIPNLADQYPFDGKKWGEDKDQDGIADFIDLSFTLHSASFEMAKIQEDIFRYLNVTIIHGSDVFTKEEWQAFEATLFHETLISRLQFKELKTIVRYSKNEQQGLTRAEFDPFWKQISFFPNEEHRDNIPAFTGSLVHELGHVHAAENSDTFEQFIHNLSDWVSPSHYGNSSPEEGYAEAFVLEYHQEGELQIDPQRFDLL
jgi:hypothetical protein